jgi:transcriptional regulator with XRE-family HTH domain
MARQKSGKGANKLEQVYDRAGLLKIARIVAEEFERRDVSQNEFSRLMGVAANTISAMLLATETGVITILPDVGTLVQIAPFLTKSVGVCYRPWEILSIAAPSIYPRLPDLVDAATISELQDAYPRIAKRLNEEIPEVGEWTLQLLVEGALLHASLTLTDFAVLSDIPISRWQEFYAGEPPTDEELESIALQLNAITEANWTMKNLRALMNPGQRKRGKCTGNVETPSSHITQADQSILEGVGNCSNDL